MMFAQLDDGKGFITYEVFMEALGGEEVIEADKRLKDLFWQIKEILGG